MKIKQDKNNFRIHSEENKSLIKKSVDELGAGRSVLIDSEDTLIAGNGVIEQWGKRPTKVIETDGTELIVVKRTDLKTKDKKRKLLALADNQTSDLSEFDIELVENEFGEDELTDWGFEIIDNTEKNNGSLAKQFLIPPFSVLDTRQKYWQDRKQNWKGLINDKGESRDGLLFKGEGDPVSEKIKKSGTVSILDSVLAEISNIWFGIPNCKTFDCFAGDTVFGYVSSYLKNEFTGIELRKEQTDLNNERIKEFKQSKYICDDGQNILKHIKENSQDLLFSCPPYYDLEKYSDLENDASNQKNYKDFLNILNKAFTDSIKCLKDNRFAIIVVGDIRDNKGFYRRFTDDVKDIFKSKNMLLYNEFILINSIGTAALRAPQFNIMRKPPKVHQNVLVFFKGDPKEIKNIYPKLDFSQIEQNESEDMELFQMD
jgi:hypothetical protein